LTKQTIRIRRWRRRYAMIADSAKNAQVGGLIAPMTDDTTAWHLN